MFKYLYFRPCCSQLSSINTVPRLLSRYRLIQVAVADVICRKWHLYYRLSEGGDNPLKESWIEKPETPEITTRKFLHLIKSLRGLGIPDLVVQEAGLDWGGRVKT